MKNIITLIVLSLTLTVNAQLFDRATGIEYKVDENSFQLKDFQKSQWNYKRSIWGYGIAFVGGVANGINQTILHHYPQFQKVHPNADPGYWNPDQSWKRKYKDYDAGDMSEAFFLSKTALSGFTDAYHLTSQLSTGSIIAATCVITIGEKRKWWEYGIDIVGMSVARSIGFHLPYTIIYK